MALSLLANYSSDQSESDSDSDDGISVVIHKNPQNRRGSSSSTSRGDDAAKPTSKPKRPLAIGPPAHVKARAKFARTAGIYS